MFSYRVNTETKKYYTCTFVTLDYYAILNGAHWFNKDKKINIETYVPQMAIDFETWKDVWSQFTHRHLSVTEAVKLTPHEDTFVWISLTLNITSHYATRLA